MFVLACSANDYYIVALSSGGDPGGVLGS